MGERAGEGDGEGDGEPPLPLAPRLPGAGAGPPAAAIFLAILSARSMRRSGGLLGTVSVSSTYATSALLGLASSLSNSITQCRNLSACSSVSKPYPRARSRP